MRVFKVPKNLKIYKKVNYPPHNSSFNLEGEISRRLIKRSKDINTKFTFLPIQWTNYFIKNKYGKNLDEIKKFYEKKIKNSSKKFFTVLQYADGNLFETSSITYFAASGLKVDFMNSDTKLIKIPLLAEKHHKQLRTFDKKFLASFIGRNTHPIRENLIKEFGDNSAFYIEVFDEPVISDERQKKFVDLMNSSFFSLAPRGYGVTSYRLYESFEFSTVPVYISNEKEYYLPFEDIIDWKKLCVFFDPDKDGNLQERLEEIISSGEYEEMLEYGDYCNRKFFNFDYVTEYIIDKVEIL